MAKVNEDARKRYMELVSPYRKKIAEIGNSESRLDTILKNNAEPYRNIARAENNLSITSYHLIINSLSVALLGVRNENSLADAKKSCSVSIIQLEQVFTDLIDVPFSEYENALNAVSSYNELKRYSLIRKTGLTLALVSEAFGENTKWKWALVDLKARLATLAKNCINLKTLVAGLDPCKDGYREHQEFLAMVTGLLENTADSYRTKYEVSTKRIDDFRKAITYLGALYRILVLIDKPYEANKIKKKYEIWKKRMEADYKNKEVVENQKGR